MEVDAASFNCLKEDQKLDKGQHVWNKWLGQWELAWVNNTLASHWAVQRSWHVITCFLSTSGCREYRTARHNSADALFPPPYLHGNFKNVLDCTARSSPTDIFIDSGARTSGNGSCSLAGIRPASPSFWRCSQSGAVPAAPETDIAGALHDPVQHILLASRRMVLV
jgi:hypothetical protein